MNSAVSTSPRKLPLLIVLLAPLLLLVVLATTSRAAEHDVFTPEERSAVEGIVRDYLLRNPEVVLEVLNILQDRERRVAAQEAQGQLVARRDELFNDPGSPVGWNQDGDVTIVEFFDYRCPYCRAMASPLSQLSEQDDGIRFVYKEWPILGPVSVVAAKAALAAWKQGPYEEFHEVLMTYQGQLSEEAIFKAATEIGLDLSQLRRDMEDPEIEEWLSRTRRLASALGVTGTPAFVIGNQLVPGAISLDDLKDLVRRAREEG
jgi:protein-disulfide isomerase